MIPYGKRRYVPACCPLCGIEQLKPPIDGMTLDWLLQAMWSSWRPVLREHPSPAFAGLPWWYGDCGNCRMRAELLNPSPWLQFLKKKPVARTIQFPFRITHPKA